MNVLLVEDNALDARMFGRAARRSSFSGCIDAVGSGEEALAALSDAGEDRYELVVLDINLPGISGFDVLHHLHTAGADRQLPVIILSSSSADSDIDKAYRTGAAAYITKPVGNADYDQVVGAIGAFWSDAVAYPG